MTTKAKVVWEGDQVSLVTGGAGFIGSHLVRELVSQNKKVVVYDFTPDTSYIADCLDKITFVYGDVSDMLHLMETMSKYGVTNVFHLAYMLVPDTDNRLATAVRVNCEGFVNVMQASRLLGIKRVVWASTQSVYGKAESYPPGPVREDVFVNPTTLYGACKLFNEHVGRFYRDVHGLDNFGYRKSVAFGLGKSRRRDLSIAHLLIENAILGKTVELPPVDYSANYLYVKDIVRAYILGMKASQPKNYIFNIGGTVYLNSELVNLLKEMIPGVTTFQQKGYGLPHPIEVFEQDMDAARDQLGYEPAYTVEEAVRDYQQVIEKYGEQYKSTWTEFVTKSLI